MLSRELAAAGHYPAIDVGASRSRLMTRVADAAHRDAATRARQALARYREIELLLQIGEFQRGVDPEADRAVDLQQGLRGFLRQAADEARLDLAGTLARLQQVLGS